MNTRGMWLDVPLGALEILASKRYNIAASIHAAEHAILSLLPNFVISSPGDVRTECKAPQKEYAKVNPPISESILMVDGNPKTTTGEVTPDFRSESDMLDSHSTTRSVEEEVLAFLAKPSILLICFSAKHW